MMFSAATFGHSLAKRVLTEDPTKVVKFDLPVLLTILADFILFLPILVIVRSFLAFLSPYFP